MKVFHFNTFSQFLQDYNNEYIGPCLNKLIDEPVVLIKHNENCIFDFDMTNKFTDVGYRIAYFLWCLKGDNKLQGLQYYKKFIKDRSDNNINLRGAYGPRMRFWVGADQLQEATNKNLNIDDPEDQVKPIGVDQLNMIYQDLKNDMKLSTCIILDPSIDFENSKNIPDLVSFTFSLDGDKLDLHLNYSIADISEDFMNDYFLFNLLHYCYCKLLNVKIGKVYYNIIKCFVGHKLLEQKDKYKMDKESNCFPQCDDPDKLWQDIFKVYDFEKHLRCAVYEHSVDNLQINLNEHCNKLIEKFLDKIEDDFWKDFGYILLAYSLYKYGKEKYMSYIESIIEYIKTPLKDCIVKFICSGEEND